MDKPKRSGLYLHTLMESFDFTLDDLQVNEQGILSEHQKRPPFMQFKPHALLAVGAFLMGITGLFCSLTLDQALILKNREHYCIYYHAPTKRILSLYPIEDASKTPFKQIPPQQSY